MCDQLVVNFEPCFKRFHASQDQNQRCIKPVNIPILMTLPFKDQKSADSVRRQLHVSDLGKKINCVLQPVFTSKKLWRFSVFRLFLFLLLTFFLGSTFHSYINTNKSRLASLSAGQSNCKICNFFEEMKWWMMKNDEWWKIWKLRKQSPHLI